MSDQKTETATDEAAIPAWQNHPEVKKATQLTAKLRGELGEVQRELRGIESRLAGGPSSALEAEALALLGDPTANQRGALVTAREDAQRRVQAYTRALEIANESLEKARATAVAEYSRQAHEGGYKPRVEVAIMAYLDLVCAATDAQLFLGRMSAAGLADPRVGAPLGGGMVPLSNAGGAVTAFLKNLIHHGWISEDVARASAPDLFK